VGMNAAMPCPEYVCLRRDYEAALRLWADVLLVQHTGLIDGVEKALEIRKAAADTRESTSKRVDDHKRSCPVCRAAIRQFQNPHKGFKPSKS
jgi:hypothetical protein